MKKIFILSLIGIGLATLSFTTPPNLLIGRWQKRLPNGVVVGALFRSDSSFDGLVNGKFFVSGKYFVRQDTFALTDGGCGRNYYGTYKLTFVTDDSIHFAAIQDTCGGRRRGNNGLTLGRATPGRPK